MKLARLYESLPEKKVKCLACNHYCKIVPGKLGICGGRKNREGELFSLVYDRVVAASVDPIEKKPIFHLKPGSLSYSIATGGCNLKCRFCQNSDIAQLPKDWMENERRRLSGRAFAPKQIVDQALAHGCESISYTYTEPTVFFELALDTARLAKEKGLYNIFVTNGFMSPELIQEAIPVLDAVNVDLKAFTEDFYRTLCKASLEPVKKTLKMMKQAGIMVEVTTLVIPGLNDDPDDFKRMAGFIAQDLGPQTPWHLSRFHPAYKLLDIGPTPVATLEQACAIGESAGLKHVYTGNVPGAKESTYCSKCGNMLVQRHGYRIDNLLAENGKCPGCGTALYGIY